MKKLFILFFMLSNLMVFGQLDLLPQDPNVLIGTLDNGMKYYIRSNKTPAHRGEFSLVVNAGSVLEDDDQQGLAHFTEHMAFNGTKNFPKHELIEYLESLGMKFGAEVNAYTSFDQTVYGITIPTDSVDKLDKGLLVLYDWAFQVLFEDEEIKAESGVIHEEWRLHQGAYFRIQDKLLNALFNGSKYAQRTPIGQLDIIDNCDGAALRRFYNDWYRPDLMAVVIVGDFDAKTIEKKVRDLFGQIKNVDNPRERPTIPIPNNNKPIFAVASDKELPQSIIQILYKHDLKKKTTVADYRNSLIEELLSSMLSARLSELTIDENPPFSFAGGGVSEFMGLLNAFTNVGMILNNNYQKTLDALIAENLRMAQYGFTQTELDREKANMAKLYDQSFKERDKQKSTLYLEEYQSNFLYQTPIPGIVFEAETVKKYLPEISLEEINNYAKTLVNDNAVVLLIMPEKEGFKVPTETELEQLYYKAYEQQVTAYIDNTSNKPFISKMPQPGKINKKIVNKKIDTETWVLKNGVKVIIKNTDFKDDEILMMARSYGGSSLYDVSDDINADIACAVAKESGMGNYNKVEFDKFMSGKTADFNSYIGEITEGITGSCSVSDLETLLQLIYVNFSNPKITESAFNSYINKEKDLLENMSLAPESVWRDSISWIMSNYNVRSQPLSPKRLDEANYKRVQYIYKNRFRDPNNFTFVFVGNIDIKQAKPLIEKYLGSMQMIETDETYRDLNIRPPKGVIEKEIFRGQSEKCLETCYFHGEMEYNQVNKIYLDAICKLLTTKLLEEIREKESGVYSIYAYPNFQAHPYPNYKIAISYSCDPNREKELFSKIINIINDFKTIPVEDKDIAKTKEKIKKEHETNIRENSWWLHTLASINDETYSVEDFQNYLTDINKINSQTMQATAIKYFDMNNYVKVSLLPEEH